VKHKPACKSQRRVVDGKESKFFGCRRRKEISTQRTLSLPISKEVTSNNPVSKEKREGKLGRQQQEGWWL